MSGPESHGFWLEILDWIAAYRVGDLASVAGVMISLVGFGITLYGVSKSKSAAQRAEDTARSTRDSIRLVDTVVDFSAAITILEEIKRLHRTGQWTILPDRYAALRKLLVLLRSTTPDMTDSQRAVIQNALTNLYSMEAAVERGLGDTSALKPAKFNTVISRDVDQLVATLAELKAAKAGV